MVLAGIVGVGIPGTWIIRCRETPMAPLTLFEALAALPDPRSPHGRIHPLPAVLGMVALAMLLGRKSLAGTARFGRQHGTPLAHALGFRRGKTPTVSTLSRAMFCQRDVAEAVVDSGGDSVFTVKDNQPGLKADIQAAFGFEAAATSPHDLTCALIRLRGDHDR